MNWTMLGAVGEILGAIAVVLSLVYLARQVRDGALEQARARWLEVNREVTTYSDSIAHDGEWADIVFRGWHDRDALTPVEVLRFNAGHLKLFSNWEAVFHYSREGGVHDWGAEAFLRRMEDMVGLPGLQAYWKGRRHWYTEDFASQVDRLMEKSPPQMLKSYESAKEPKDS